PSVFNLNETLCEGASMEVNGVIYNQNNPNGTEILVGADVNGCDSIVNITLNFFPPAVFDLNETLCEGESIEVNGVIYNQNNLSGTEVLSGASVNGCDSIVNITLNYIFPSTRVLDTLLCFGESLQVNGVRYDASNPTGTEVIMGGSANGCDSIIQVNLRFAPEIVGSIEGDAQICAGERTTLTFRLSGGQSFDVRYSDGVNPPVELINITDGHTVEISPTRTATYTIVFLAINGSPCSASINGSARVQVSNLTASASVVSNFGGFGLSCAGSNDGTIRANAADGLGPFTYQWSTGSTAQQLNGVEIGTYAVTIEDAAGCSAEASVAVTAPATLTASSSTRDPLCSGDRSGAILIDAVNGGVGPYEVSLDGTSYRAMGSFPYELGNLAAGNYNVFVRDANDCEIAFNTTVVAISNPRIDLGGDITIALGDSVALEGIANFEPDKVEWRPTDFLSTPDALRTVVRPAETTTYQVTASDASGCIATDRITVFVNKARKIFIPTAFSPDGDGNNDIFYIYGGNDVVQVRRFVIFDRWGNLLFDRGPFLPNDPQHGWDGRFNGQEVNIGVYVYYAEIEFIDGIIEVFEGDVAVLR
ncbi:MAG TPA: gliding motility-associated C-terminal domain-containing protein, partial [Saprospiraceae bacterium]|nr:gliding motility-associated C-terminal domain-containing protein [Saprospiraceae bacterium]